MRHTIINPITVLLGIYLLSAQCAVKNYAASTAAAQNKPGPNVILINVDDLGYGDAGCYGATHVQTPNIDQLAKEGRRFTDFHSASSVCSPSRYGLMTGEYPVRKQMWRPIFLRAPSVIDDNQLTIGKLMQKAGYQTAAFGKWHLGFGVTAPVNWNSELKPGPLERGFHYYFGVPVLNSHPPFVYVENHHVVGLVPGDPMVYGQRAETELFPEKFHLDSIGGGAAAHRLYKDKMVGTTLTRKAVAWMKAQAKKPFFLYFAPTNIHHPFTPAPRFEGTSKAGLYGDMIHELDWMVGELLRTLEEEGLTKNTLVILTSDNGGMLNLGGQQAWKLGHRQNGPLLGFKFDAWEGGHRVPFIARWPGKIAAGTTSNTMLCNIDMMATLAALTGQTLKSGEGPDSYNALPALVGAPDQNIRDYLIISPAQKQALAIRKGDWMYISAQNSGGFPGTVIGEHELGGAAAHLLTLQVNSDVENGKIKADAAPAQLYNLKADPYQKTNMYNQHPEVVQELKTLLEEATTIKQSTRSK